MRLLLPVPLVLLAACSDMALTGTHMGVTPGGSQDIGFAREIIDAGYIPRDGQYTAEGLFSEHDLPLPDDPCDATLCPRAAAMPFSPIDGSGPAVLVQLGFATNVSPATFERQPLNLALAVDISGSMAGKMDAVHTALHTLVDQLHDDDTIALIAFDDTARVVLPMGAADAARRDALDAAIDRLEPSGGTSIEAGLRDAYGEVAPDAGRPGIEDRVMLFTDAQPNVDATDVDSFLGMARYYAASGIGISVFGVGMDFGSELADAIAKTPGGNSFYLTDTDAIAQVFDEDFDFIVSPIAYDLDVQVTPAASLAFTGSYGAPMDDAGETVELGAATLFLSSGDGGMGASLTGDGVATLEPGDPLASFTLSWDDLEGGTHDDALTVTWNGGVELGGEPTQADALGVYVMSGLVDEFLSLDAGDAFCDGTLDPDESDARIAAAIEVVDGLATQLSDDALADEAALLTKLRANVATGSSACYAEDAYVY